MNRELNKQVAGEVMGWKKLGWYPLAGIPPGTPVTPITYAVEVPDYSGSMDAAFEMEEEIERQGEEWPYSSALLLIACAHEGFRPEDVGDTWDIIHATPEQRCKAALKTVREKKLEEA